jgi:hypothetical protein
VNHIYVHIRETSGLKFLSFILVKSIIYNLADFSSILPNEWIEYKEAHGRLPFWAPRNLSHHMIWEVRTGDTVLVKSSE